MANFEYRSSWFSKQSTLDEIERKPIDHVLAVFRCLISVLVVTVPWYYGAVDWTSQYFFLMLSIPICLLSFGGLVYQHIRQKRSNGERSEMVLTAPPWPSVVIVLVAVWALIQSLPLYSVTGGDRGPSSVRIQRLYLGESIPSLEKEFGLVQTPLRNDFISDKAKDNRLSWSIEPLNTKAAIGMIALVSALIWLGRVYFSSEAGLPWILTLTTAIGVAVAMFGVASLLSWNATNLLGLRKGTSFGPFISRNIGGCFLNICLSGAIGLTVWAFENKKRQHVDQRYSAMRTTFFEKLMGRVEGSFGQLTTFQIACVIASSIIFASVIATSSRGATIGALVAVLAVFIVSFGSGVSFGRILVAASFLVIGASFLFWFELDDRLRSRLDQSIWDEQFEAGRRLVWGIAYHATQFYFWTGSGLGTFHFSHLPFQQTATPYWFQHAESLYWDAMVDLGWVGVLAILGMVITFASILWPPSLRYKDDRPIKKLGATRITGLALFLSVGLHSFFDFSMIVPACFVPASLLLGAVYGGSKWEDENQRRKTRTTRSGLQQRIGGRSLRERSAEASAKTASPDSSTTKPEEKKSRASLREINASGFFLRGNVVRKLIMSSLLLGLMGYSLPSLDLMARADRMRLWTARQIRLPVAKRSINPSLFTAGIWGNDTASFDKSADGMRTVAYALMNEFQQIRSNELETILHVPAKEAEALSTPTITHIGLSQVKDNPTGLDEFFISSKQKMRWLKTEELFHKAIVRSPLDWRISYGIYLLDYQMPDDQFAALADRLRHITMHRPDMQLQMAAIEHSLGRKDNALTLLGSTLSGSDLMDVRVAKLLMQWYPDSEIPTDIFPADAASLLRVSNVISKSSFPDSYDRILQRAHEAAESLTRLDPMRSVYLAKIAKDQGDLKSALEYYKEASRRTSNSRLKIDMINTAIEAGDFEFAAEEITNLRYTDGKNPQIKVLEQALEKARQKSY